MLKQSRPMPTYSDGWAAIYSPTPAQTSFGAVENSLKADPDDLVVRVAYKLCSKRDQDFEFAERRGFDLSLKICAIRREGVNAGCRAVIGDRLFDISHMDLTQTEMYLYLQEVGKVDIG